jgi:hypothetical protein
MSQGAAISSANSARDAADWQPFGDNSFAGKMREVSNELCAPPVIVMFPASIKRARVARPHGINRTMHLWIDESWALLVNRHLQAMRARGQKPYFDLNHEGGRMGYPLDVWWKPSCGVMCLVEWEPLAEQAILQGVCNGFSPSWIHNSKEDDGLLGIELNCGALLATHVNPGFEGMPPIRPVRQAAALKEKTALFLNKVDALAAAKKATGDQFSAVHAWEEISLAFPQLRAAYELRAALAREIGKDIDLIHR